VRAYAETFGVPVTITNCANNFGPYQFPEKALPLFVTNLIDGKPVPVYGDGLNVRDWTYVDDNAAAQWMVLTEGAPGEVYNVGAGNELTNLELVQTLLAQFERSHEPERWIEHVEDRAGHDRRYSVDTRRIRALGWKPAHSFDEALAETIAWYRANEAWWRPLVPR
jgi:dTDP-glucose 4,6-dehydratase